MPYNNPDFNQMLAPYQQMAQQVSSPYATMQPNSWLAQKHPQLAGVLDNVFLTGAMTPGPQGPEGVGGGISRMMQGLMGANQFRRNQTIENSMLPYKMAMGQLQAQDVMSQIKEREANVPFKQAEQRRYDAQADLYNKKVVEADNSRYVPGGLKTDDKGNEWQEIFSPVDGRTRMFSPTTQKYADTLGAGEQPTFANERKNQRMSTPGGLMGEIMDMRMSGDPAMKARGLQMSDMYTQMTSGLAAKRAGAEQEATQPAKDLNTFVQDERRAAYSGLIHPMNEADYFNAHMTDPGFLGQNMKNPGAPYQGYLKQKQAERTQLDVDLSKYTKSTAPSRGVSFNEYLQNRAQYDGTPSAIAPSTPAPSNSASTWTPK